MVLKGVAIVYGLSFVTAFVLAFWQITPQSHPTVYPALVLIAESIGVALALYAVRATRLSYLVILGITLWLVSGTSVLAEAQSVTSWLESIVFVAAAITLGRLILGTSRAASPLDLSLSGIAQRRNSALLGNRAGRSVF
jgi:hypothetical protein